MGVLKEIFDQFDYGGGDYNDFIATFAPAATIYLLNIRL